MPGTHSVDEGALGGVAPQLLKITERERGAGLTGEQELPQRGNVLFQGEYPQRPERVVGVEVR